MSACPWKALGVCEQLAVVFVLVILIILDWLLLVISFSSLYVNLISFTSHSDLEDLTDPNIDEEMMKAYKVSSKTLRAFATIGVWRTCY